MTHPIVVLILFAGVTVCFVGAWISNRRWTRELDAYGADCNCPRWPSESNREYLERLRARVGLS
jgi:hypothetical protein